MSKEKEHNKYGWNDVKPVAKNKSLVSELKTFKSGATCSSKLIFTGEPSP